VPLAAVAAIPGEDQAYIDMIRGMFSKKTFYFSYTYDLT
jgi:hypothetical protein